jgi:hypothetical protein
MASYSDYLDTDYLPGDIYRASASQYHKDPVLAGKYIENKRWKFKPDDEGTAFQDFLALSRNPDLLMQGFMQMPGIKDMNEKAAMLGG